MYTGVYKLQAHQSVDTVVSEKPICSDGFLLLSLQRLTREYIGIDSLEGQASARLQQSQTLFEMICDYLIRYTTQSVESIIEDTLNGDIFAKGIDEVYDRCRQRKYKTLTPRKQFWLPKANVTTDRSTGKTSKASQICTNYNSKGCNYPQCVRKHVCSKCKGSHPVTECKSNA